MERSGSVTQKLGVMKPVDSQAVMKKIVVLFDGQCNFCRSQIDRLARFDGKNRIEYVSLHEPHVKTDYPNLSFDQLMEQMWVITPEGQQYGGADSLKYLSRKLPRLWFLMPFLHFPLSMPLWRFLYRQIAKRRYKIAGRNCDEGGTCSLHR
jgi:predicted DCC family thiol-disulfide oxidoreductase YuxK